MKILPRYVITEFLPSTFIGLAVFTFVLILDRIFDLTRLVINRGIAITTVLRLLGYVLPSLMTVSIPMAILAGTLLCFGRLSNDNEITAIRASGISLYRIILPVITLSLIVSILLIQFNGKIAPQYLFKFRKIYFQLLYKHPVLKLEEHTFINIKDYRIYVEKIKHKGSKLSGIVIYQMKKNKLPTLITANRGFMKTTDQKVTLYLFDGNIQEREKDNPDRYNIINFQNYDIVLNISRAAPPVTRRIREMTQKELKEEIKKLKGNKLPATSLFVEYHQRLVFAFASIVFCLVGAPLGIKTRAKGKSVGFGLSLILIFLYSFVLALGVRYVDKRMIHPVIGMWISNVIFGVLGCWLIYITAKK